MPKVSRSVSLSLCTLGLGVMGLAVSAGPLISRLPLSTFTALSPLAAMPSMSDDELAQVEGQGAQIIDTTLFGPGARIVITPSGIINATAHGSNFPSGDLAQLTRSTATVDGIPFTGQTVVTPSGHLNSHGLFNPDGGGRHCDFTEAASSPRMGSCRHTLSHPGPLVC